MCYSTKVQIFSPTKLTLGQRERGGPEEGTTHHGGAARPIGGEKRKAGRDRTASIAPRRCGCGCRPVSCCTSARCIYWFSQVTGAVTNRICSDRTSGLVADALEKPARSKFQ